MNKVEMETKREFIRWFLENYQLRRRECFWVMNRMLREDGMMERVFFVDDAKRFDNSLEMSVYNVDAPDFKYYKNQVEITDAQLMYEKIRINDDKGENLYIQLNFPLKEENKKYLEVLHDNSATLELEKRMEELAENLLQEQLDLGTCERLKKLMDKALDNKNKKDFEKLNSQFKELQKKLNK